MGSAHHTGSAHPRGASGARRAASRASARARQSATGRAGRRERAPASVASVSAASGEDPTVIAKSRGALAHTGEPASGDRDAPMRCRQRPSRPDRGRAIRRRPAAQMSFEDPPPAPTEPPGGARPARGQATAGRARRGLSLRLTNDRLSSSGPRLGRGREARACGRPATCRPSRPRWSACLRSSSASPCSSRDRRASARPSSPRRSRVP